MPGVRYVVEIPNGVAVVATSFWAAKKGRDALKVEWDDASGVQAIVRRHPRRVQARSRRRRAQSRATTATRPRRSPARRRRSRPTYEFPYLAHAAMEPMNCVVKLDADRCEVWNGEQFQTGDQAAVAKVVGPQARAGQDQPCCSPAAASAGARTPQSDYVVEAASIAKALASSGKRGIPVKLVWTREDDMTRRLLPARCTCTR